MNLSAPFIHRPVMTNLVMIALCSVGILCYLLLPVSTLPDVDYPVINVTASLPGGSPQLMANSVATPLENQFMTIPGLISVTSTNTLGNTSIILQFELDKSMDSAATDVESAIGRAAKYLPPTLPNAPVYAKVNPSDAPILYLALGSDTAPLDQLYTYAHSIIGQRLSIVDGVAQVSTYGSPYAVRIQMDPDKLTSLGLSFQDVANTVTGNNPIIPLGELYGPMRAMTLISDIQVQSAADSKPLVVTYGNNAPLRLKDLGTCVDSLQNYRTLSLFLDPHKQQRCVVLAVQRQPGSNTVEISDAIKAFLPKLAAQLPASMDLHVVFDRAQTIKESVQDVKFTLLVSFLLVVFVIFFYLGDVRDTVIPSFVLPISVIGTFPIMYLCHFTIDNLSLLGLILAMGFIIDDAIVVLENIVRRVEAGENPWQAAMEGSKQIGFTIVSMTLSLIAAFIPLLFMGGLIGKIFSEFAIVLAVITLLSGLISLTFTPMLCSRFVTARGENHRTGLASLSHRFHLLMLAGYQRVLTRAFRFRKTMLLLGFLSVVFSGIFFYYLPKDFLPDEDIGFILGYTVAQEGTSPEKMMYYQEQVQEKVRKDPSVSSVLSLASTQDPRQGLLFIRLTPRGTRPSSFALIQKFFPLTNSVMGVNTYLKNVPLISLAVGITGRGTYQYTLQSLDVNALYDSADKLEKRMQESPLFQGVNSDLSIKNPQVHFYANITEAARLGVNVAQIQQALSLAYSGGRASFIQTALDQYDIIVEALPRYQKRSLDLSKIYLKSPISNAIVPLSAVSSWKEDVGPSVVSHLNQFPAVTVSFNMAPNVPLGEALGELDRIAKEILPTSVTGSAQGTAQAFGQAISNISVLLCVAVAVIYIILGILYESYIHPITILSTLPSAILGGLITLWMFQLPLSLYAYLGILLLIGIVKKNGIIMVDYALHNQRSGKPSEEAMFDACLVRFRPIMMTTVTAIVGALPIAIGIGAGADARRPLGLVIVGGLIFSQLITLFLTPVVYLYMERFHHQKKSVSLDSSRLSDGSYPDEGGGR